MMAGDRLRYEHDFITEGKIKYDYYLSMMMFKPYGQHLDSPMWTFASVSILRANDEDVIMTIKPEMMMRV